MFLLISFGKQIFAWFDTCFFSLMINTTCVGTDSFLVYSISGHIIIYYQPQQFQIQIYKQNTWIQFLKKQFFCLRNLHVLIWHLLSSFEDIIWRTKTLLCIIKKSTSTVLITDMQTKHTNTVSKETVLLFSKITCLDMAPVVIFWRHHS